MKRKELSIGIIIWLFYTIFNRFLNIPDFFAGIIQGIGMLLIVIGILPDKSYDKLKSWKESLINSK